MNRRRWTGRRGGAAAEFMLVVPPLLLLSLPIADLTWYYVNLQRLETAVQNGVRAAARRKLTEDPAGTAVYVAKSGLAVSMPKAPTTTYSAALEGNFVRLTANMPYQPIAGIAPMPGKMSVTYRMRLEDP